ncbi:MAG: hypothetical protein WBM77_11475, partial [Maribacter sp.]
LDNSKKEEVLVETAIPAEVTMVTAPAPEATKAMEVEVQPTPMAEQQELDVQPMSAQEMKEMIARAKEGQADDDCLMCGS